jgi:membrane-bound serine protease (ClpP class)
VALLSGIGMLFGANAASEQADQVAAETAPPSRALLLEVDGPIGPATTHYLTDGFEHAADEGYTLVVIKLDTPGGLTAATRDIVKAMRRSTVPVAVWVAPEGARAASAGTYMLYASHVAAMAPATNVGAATPVSVGGGSSPAPQPGDGKKEQPSSDGEGGDGGGNGAQEGQPAAGGSAKKEKAINDAAAWIRGLAQETGRNADWAEKAVREAVSLTAEEAVAKNVADLQASTITDLLSAVDGRTVEVAGQAVTLTTAGATVDRREPDWRSELLSVITNPTVAYLLMMVGIYGLLLEGYNPGAIVPGTVGAISLLLALYAFQILPVNYAGLLLMALGAILIVAEAFAPSFGVLGIGGVVAMVAGSVILMDTDTPGFEIALEAITGTALFASLILAAIVAMAVRAWRQPIVSGGEGLAGDMGQVMEPVTPEGGVVRVQGERWSARSDAAIDEGQRVRVVGREGLVLRVERATEQ